MCLLMDVGGTTKLLCSTWRYVSACKQYMQPGKIRLHFNPTWPKFMNKSSITQAQGNILYSIINKHQCLVKYLIIISQITVVPEPTSYIYYSFVILINSSIGTMLNQAQQRFTTKQHCINVIHMHVTIGSPFANSMLIHLYSVSPLI